MTKKRKELPVESTPPCNAVVFPLGEDKGTCVDCGMVWTREGHKAAIRREEISELKRGWASDPCFDIEDTEGFEDVREELRQFRFLMEAKWAGERMERLNKLAENLGFKVRPTYESGVQYVLDPEVFAEYMEKLLGNIVALEDRLEQAEIKLDKLGDATDLRFERLERRQ